MKEETLKKKSGQESYQRRVKSSVAISVSIISPPLYSPLDTVLVRALHPRRLENLSTLFALKERLLGNSFMSHRVKLFDAIFAGAGLRPRSVQRKYYSLAGSTEIPKLQKPEIQKFSQ